MRNINYYFRLLNTRKSHPDGGGQETVQSGLDARGVMFVRELLRSPDWRQRFAETNCLLCRLPVAEVCLRTCRILDYQILHLIL